jgi:hypothetical protein
MAKKKTPATPAAAKKGVSKTTDGKKRNEAQPAPARKKPTGKPPKVIRMLTSLGNVRSFQQGHSYRVPQDVPVDTARSWVACGAAEKVE